MVNRKQDAIPNDLSVIRPYFQGEIGYCRLQATGLVDETLTPAGDLIQLHGLPVVAFAGIANPDSFRSLILQGGIDLRRFLIFPDHHFYSDDDIAGITSTAAAEQCAYLLTTEKDMVKLAVDRFNGLHLLAVRIRLILESPQRLQQKLYEFIDKTI
jgi:tetraacyldisaccharide-1-P 4'-kinase